MTTQALALSALPPLRVTQSRVLLSEWTKFRSLRSTLWTLVAAVVLIVGLGTLFCAVTAANWDQIPPGQKVTFTAVGTSLSGIVFGQLAIGVLAVLLITGEYSTGMIRSSLTAVPRRLPVLWAKMAIFAVAALLVTTGSGFLAFLAGQPFLAKQNLSATLSDPGVLRAIFGAGLYVAVAGLIAMAVGALLRSTAGAISTYVGVFFVLPPLTNLLPQSWREHFTRYLPSEAGGAVYGNSFGDHPLAPWTGFAVVCVYAVVLSGLAAWSMLRRDA